MFIHNHAYFLSVKLLEKLINKKSNYIDFFFDGNNFRGYGLDTEIIAKAYANNFSAAITNQVYVEENESFN